LLHAFKFRGDLAAGAALTELLLGAVVSRGARRGIDALVPVPMPAARLRSRGFNQAALIAQDLGRATGIRVLRRGCRRIGAPKVQSSLGRASDRLRNVRGSFVADRSAVEAAEIAIVDDLITTGATAGELARVLLSRGAARVEVWALARTAFQNPRT
jgi:ComF family protein